MTKAAEYVAELRGSGRQGNYVGETSDTVQRTTELMAQGIAEQIGKTMAQDPVGIASSLRDRYDMADTTTGPAIMNALFNPPTDLTMKQVQSSLLGVMQEMGRLKKEDKAHTDEAIAMAASFGNMMGNLDQALQKATMEKQQRVDFVTGVVHGAAEVAATLGGRAGETLGELATTITDTVGNWLKQGNELSNDQIMASFMMLGLNMREFVGYGQFSAWQNRWNRMNPGGPKKYTEVAESQDSLAKTLGSAALDKLFREMKKRALDGLSETL